MGSIIPVRGGLAIPCDRRLNTGYATRSYYWSDKSLSDCKDYKGFKEFICCFSFSKGELRWWIDGKILKHQVYKLSDICKSKKAKPQDSKAISEAISGQNEQ